MPALKRRQKGAGKLRSRSHEVRQPEASRRTGWAFAGAAAVVALAGSIGLYAVASAPGGPLAAGDKVGPGSSFVGSQACVGCHRPESERWQASQHKQAMDHANEKTVLGDF